MCDGLGLAFLDSILEQIYWNGSDLQSLYQADLSLPTLIQK